MELNFSVEDKKGRKISSSKGRVEDIDCIDRDCYFRLKGVSFLFHLDHPQARELQGKVIVHYRKIDADERKRITRPDRSVPVRGLQTLNGNKSFSNIYLEEGYRFVQER
jgi:hypothetical protein